MIARPALLVLLGLALGTSALAADRPSLLVVLPAGPPPGALLAPALTALGRSDRYRALLVSTLLPLMRERDEREQVRRRATALVEEGRQLLVSLDHDRARAKLEEALQILERGFVRYYDPQSLAQVRLLLGMWALDRARPDLAHRELAEAHRLDPGLTLGPHYSPQLRAAFEQARQGPIPHGAPSTEELQKLLRLSSAPAAAVLEVEAAGERSLVRGAVFAATGTYAGVESVLVEVGSPEAAGRAVAGLGAQLRRIAEPLFPAPTPPTTRQGGDGQFKRPITPPVRGKPWWRRWYTWAAAGAVVAGTVAIILPVTLRREVVESTLRW